MKRFTPQTSKGPAERFTGSVYPMIIFTGEEPSRARMASVHFEPGAHTAWHKHAVGQYIHVVEGTAYLQERGGPLSILKPGDTVYTEPGIEHWHGASPDSFMVHIVVWEAPAPDSGQEETTWLEHVTDEEYGQSTV
jgi:quercetin dioxygenase-like cupin family protein